MLTTRSSCIRRVFWVLLLFSLPTLLFIECSAPIPLGVDTKANVRDGMSDVLVRSAAFSKTDGATGSIPSGTSVTATVAIINPASLGVSYSLSSNLPPSSFLVAPSAPVATSPTSVSFSFTLAPTVEHHDVQFTLGKSIPATGKVFPSSILSVHCDSPPNPVANLIAASDATTHNGFLSFTLPVAASDDDLSSLAISYQDVSLSPPGPTASTTISVGDPALLSLTPYAPDPLAPVTSTTKRYFKPSLTAGHAYAFVLTLSDAAGQKAATQTVGGAGVHYTLSYDLNGASGSVPATKTYTYYDLATLPPAPTWSGYVFMGWNTAADGSGTTITTDFNMTLGNITLYAQWKQVGSPTVTFSPTTYQTLAFSQTNLTVNPVSLPLVIAPSAGTLATSGTNWQWYVNASPQAGATASTYSFTNSTLGHYTVEVTVTYQGVTYSGSLNITVDNSVVPTFGLAAEWLMAGNANDTSGNGNNATVTGSVTPVSDRFGLANKAYSSAGGYLWRTGEITPATGNFTWSVWFNYSSPGAMLITQGGLVGAGGNARSLSVDPTTQRLGFYLYNTGGTVNVLSAAVSQNTWHHAVGVYDGATATLYLDGVQAGQLPFTLGTSGEANFYLGEQASYNSYTSIGSLDDVRVYNRALNASEVAALYHEGGY